MRFLCLHGMGTNSKVLEVQLAPIRFQLGDHHQYEFAEGAVRDTIAPEIEGFYSAEDDYFAYFDPTDVRTGQKALQDLHTFIAVEGPFDGVIAFSQGAVIASTLIVQQARRHPQAPPIFRCAIFFAGGQPIDPDLLESGHIRTMSYDEDGAVINVPTANIRGRNDPLPWAGKIDKLCAPDRSITYIHDGAHEIPGSKMKDTVTDCVNIIRRIVDMAEKTK